MTWKLTFTLVAYVLPVAGELNGIPLTRNSTIYDLILLFELSLLVGINSALPISKCHYTPLLCRDPLHVVKHL